MLRRNITNQVTQDIQRGDDLYYNNNDGQSIDWDVEVESDIITVTMVLNNDISAVGGQTSVEQDRLNETQTPVILDVSDASDEDREIEIYITELPGRVALTQCPYYKCSPQHTYTSHHIFHFCRGNYSTFAMEIGP